MGNIFDAAKEGVDNYSRQKDLILSNDTLTVTVKGVLSDHNQGYDQDGNPINARNAHASFSESALIEAGFTAKILNHFIQDGTKKYKIVQTTPNVTMGLVVCPGLKDV